MWIIITNMISNPKGDKIVKYSLKRLNLSRVKHELKEKISLKAPNLKLMNFKNRNIIISVLAFSILFSGVFVFSGNRENINSTVAPENNEVAPVTEFTENLVTAYGLYIDGAFIAATENKENITTALDTLLNGKVSSLPISDVTSAQIMNEIRIEENDYSLDNIVDSESLNKLLGIEDKYTFTFNLKNITGESVDKKFSVLVYAKSEEKVEIEYETTYVDTDSKKKGYEKVVCSGKTGSGIANYELVYIDDELVQSNYISTEVIAEPKTEKVERGILSGNKTVTSIGVLAFPYQGRISSYFGWRSIGYHEGIDLIAYSGGCYGDDVYAAADGVVTFSNIKGAYGKVVFIDHGDGLVTVYAHLSLMSLKVGDNVKTGDVVGQIGTTGRVTGPHLHFEVQNKGVKVDPMLFLKKE